MNPAAAEFVAGWLAAEPEGRLVQNFLAPVLRDRHAASAALVFELEEVALGIGESTVAEAKLGWWRDELERTGDGAARHPLTQALAASVPDAPYAALAAPLLELYRFESASDDTALERVIGPWVSAQGALAAAITGSEAAAWSPAALARRFLTRRLRQLAGQARLGRLWLPLDLMAAHGLTRHAFDADGGPAAAARARRAMAQRLLARRGAARPAHPAAAMLVALSDLRLESMAASGEDRLPPLRALWRAWRAAGT
jgi:phytoene synthase